MIRRGLELKQTGLRYTIQYTASHLGWLRRVGSLYSQPQWTASEKVSPFLNLNSPIQFHIRSYQYTFDLLYESDYSLHGKILSLTLEHAGYVCLQPPIHVKRESEPRRLRE